MRAMEEVRLQLVEGIRVRQEALNALNALQRVDGPVESSEPSRLKAGAPAAAVANGKRVTRFAPGKRWSKGRQPPYAACRKLEEPFGAKELAKAAGITEKGASSQVYRWAGQGLLTKVSPGVWKRSAKFPPADGAAAAPASVPTGNGNGGRDVPTPLPKLRDERAGELERQIKEACAERDKNRANGRDRMAQVYQDKIDKLQKELEAVEG